jgi:hypothetical protein
MHFIKSVIKRTLEFVIALAGAIYAVSTFISFSGLTSSSYSLRIWGNWVNTFKPAVGLATAVLLFIGIEKFLWANIQSSPAEPGRSVKRVIIAATIPVLLVGSLFLIAGLIALAGG